MSKTLDPNDWNTMEDFNFANKLEVSKKNVSMVVTNTIVTPKCTALSLIEYLEKKRFLNQLRMLSDNQSMGQSRLGDANHVHKQINGEKRRNERKGK